MIFGVVCDLDWSWSKQKVCCISAMIMQQVDLPPVIQQEACIKRSDFMTMTCDEVTVKRKSVLYIYNDCAIDWNHVCKKYMKWFGLNRVYKLPPKDGHESYDPVLGIRPAGEMPIIQGPRITLWARYMEIPIIQGAGITLWARYMEIYGDIWRYQ